MLILASDVEAPAFTRAGDRGVVRLTAGRKLAFVRDLDIQNVLCASGTPTHPMFLVVPRDQLRAQADEVPSWEEFVRDFQAVAPEELKKFEEEMSGEEIGEAIEERGRPSKTEISPHLPGGTVAPKLTPAEMDAVFRGKVSLPMDRAGRFSLNVKTRKAERNEAKKPGIRIQRGPRSESYVVEGYVVFDENTGTPHPVQSLREAYATMIKILKAERPSTAPAQHEYAGFTIRRTDDGRFTVVDPDGHPIQQLDTVDAARKFIDEKLANPVAAVEASVLAAKPPSIWAPYMTKPEPKPKAPKKERTKKKEEPAPGKHIMKFQFLQDYVNAYKNARDRFVVAERKYRDAVNQYAILPAAAHGAMSEAAELKTNVDSMIEFLIPTLAVGGQWVERIRDIPESEFTDPYTKRLQEGTLTDEVAIEIETANESIGAFEQSVQQFADAVAQLSTQRTAADLGFEEINKQIWSMDDWQKVNKFEEDRKQYHEALHVIEEVLDAAYGADQTWTIELTSAATELVDFMRDAKTRMALSESDEIEGDVRMALQMAAQMKEPLTKDTLDLIDGYLATVRPIIEMGQKAFSVLDRIHLEHPKQEPPPAHVPMPAWLYTMNPKPSGFPEDPGMRVQRRRPPEPK